MLPSGYQQLEYIQSSGTQYIDSGYYPKDNTDFYCKFEAISNGCLFGTESATSKRFCFFPRNSNNYLVFQLSSEEYNTSSVSLSTNVVYEARLTNKIFVLNNYTRVFSPSSFTAGNTVHIFKRNGGSNLYGSYKLYRLTFFENDSPVRDFIPAKRKSDNVLGLYDTVNNVFYTNAGSGTFTAGPNVYNITSNVNPLGSGYVLGTGTYQEGQSATVTAVENSGWEFVNWTLDGYTQLEYIESTGTQYIDTGIIPKHNTKIEEKFIITSLSYNGAPYGVYVGGIRQNLYYTSSIFGIGYSGWEDRSYSWQTNVEYNLEASMSNGSQTYKINGTTITSSLSGSLPQYPIFLIARNLNGSVDNKGYMKLKSFKYYESGALVRDFIPAIRHSDGALGLLDLVNLKFYGNSGTGSFIGGNPV